MNYVKSELINYMTRGCDKEENLSRGQESNP